MASEGNGSTWAIIAAFGSIILNLIVALGNGIRVLGQSRKETDDKIAATDDARHEQIIALERSFKSDIDQATRNVGEAMTAIRAKINETELWNRDNFVNKATFQTVVGNMQRMWERLEEKIDKRFDRIDEKLDKNGKD